MQNQGTSARTAAQQSYKCSLLKRQATILAILMLAAGLFVGCETKNVESKTTDTTINNCQLEIYIIDSCEYIGRVYNTNSDKLTHKGNCKYCLNRKK